MLEVRAKQERAAEPGSRLAVLTSSSGDRPFRLSPAKEVAACGSVEHLLVGA